MESARSVNPWARADLAIERVRLGSSQVGAASLGRRSRRGYGSRLGAAAASGRVAEARALSRSQPLRACARAGELRTRDRSARPGDPRLERVEARRWPPREAAFAPQADAARASGPGAWASRAGVNEAEVRLGHRASESSPQTGVERQETAAWSERLGTVRCVERRVGKSNHERVLGSAHDHDRSACCIRGHGLVAGRGGESRRRRA